MSILNRNRHNSGYTRAPYNWLVVNTCRPNRFRLILHPPTANWQLHARSDSMCINNIIIINSNSAVLCLGLIGLILLFYCFGRYSQCDSVGSYSLQWARVARCAECVFGGLKIAFYYEQKPNNNNHTKYIRHTQPSRTHTAHTPHTRR